MKKILSLILLFVSVWFIQPDILAQTSDFNISQFYPIERSHSYVEFEIKYMGYAKVKGRFTDFKGTFRYDPANLDKTSVLFSVDVSSIDTDMDFRDRDLKSNHWFDAETYPNISFESTRVKELSNGLEVAGNLTIKDVTKTVIIMMDKGTGVLKDTRGDSQVIFTGEFILNRKDYGVEGERWSALKEGITAVSSEVTIEVSLLGKKINKSNAQNFVRNPDSPPGKLYAMVNKEGVEQTIKEFEIMRKTNESRINYNTLIAVGYNLLKDGKIEQSIQILEHNTKAFPEVGNSFDSFAEALATKGDLDGARKNYEFALLKDPTNLNAKEILRHLN